MQHRKKTNMGNVEILKCFIYSFSLIYVLSISLMSCSGVRKTIHWRHHHHPMKRTLFRFLSFGPDDARHRSESAKNAINIFPALRSEWDARRVKHRAEVGERSFVLLPRLREGENKSEKN